MKTPLARERAAGQQPVSSTSLKKAASQACAAGPSTETSAGVQPSRPPAVWPTDSAVSETSLA
eukprot:10403024-Lingulodinium_polyedra.AAC.1